MDTKTDRELIELAAKAAGYKVTWNEHWNCFAHVVPISTTNPPTLSGLRHAWQPLEDDGDALRLAVKLGMDICNPHQYNVALATIETKCSYCGGDYSESFADISQCTYAGVRRSIVLAAAKIGENMK